MTVGMCPTKHLRQTSSDSAIWCIEIRDFFQFTIDLGFATGLGRKSMDVRAEAGSGRRAYEEGLGREKNTSELELARKSKGASARDETKQ